MNDRQLDTKVRKDVARIKKDLKTLADDSAARLSRYEGSVGQVTGKAKEDMTAWMNDGIAQLSDGIDKLSGSAKDTAVDAAVMVRKDVGSGLSKYNDRIQRVADKAPADLGKKAARYPWVAVSIALAAGLMLGGVIKSARKSAAQP